MEEVKETNNMKFLYKPNPSMELSPILELYRGKIYSFILKSFISTCITNLNSNIFSIKKSYPRTITNLLSSWFFTLYVDYDFQSDPFFPSNIDNTESLKETLNDFCKYDTSIQNTSSKINNILKDLKKSYIDAMKNLDDYKKSDFYAKNNNNFTITKELITQKRDSKEVKFYKFKINVPFIFKDKRQENVIDNILLPEIIYNKMKNQFTEKEELIDTYIWCIVYRYQLLGSNNNQLGVLPEILGKMKKDFNLDFECFASAINSTFNNYCSIYFDLEKYFGSKGNFFNLITLRGTYSFNPPYQKNVMDKGINKLISLLENSTSLNENLTFIITIPIWDKIGRKIMKYSYPEKKRSPDIDYSEFSCIDKVFKSSFFKAKLMIPKNKFTYLDHNFQLYKNVTIQHTYILVLSNEKKNFQEILNKYNFSNEDQKY